MLIDTHAHLNFKAFNNDRDQVISRCLEAKMKVINVGAALDSSQLAFDLSLKHNHLYASIGLHPIHIYDQGFKVQDYQDLIDRAKDRVVAIGETGFDYWHLEESLKKGAKSIEDIIQKQEDIFIEHIKLAKDNDLALIIHGRNSKDGKNAYADIYRVLKESGVKKAVVHCFGGNLEEAKKFVGAGYYLGFTGIVTFDPPSPAKLGSADRQGLKVKNVDKNSNLREVIKWIPEDRMLIETDAPYLSPEPHRGKRNEPVYVEYVAEKIAELKGKTKEEIIELTGNNAIKLFKL